MNTEIIELARYYKRLVKIELYIKHLVIHTYITIHLDKAFDRLFPYFKNIEIKRYEYRSCFSKNKKSKKTTEEILRNSVTILFFSDLINLLNEKLFYKDKVKDIFFEKTYKDEEFRHNCKLIKKFRNTIAHCNIDEFKKTKKEFISSLNYFENLLNISFYPININRFPKQTRRPASSFILDWIFKQDKNIFDDDKILIDLFDEIALMNGYSFKALPARTTIIRTRFLTKAKHKN